MPTKDIRFVKSGRGKAQCPPNPKYPNGCFLDISEGKERCIVRLPYPAPECGRWEIRCQTCGLSAGITAVGRPDDPVGVALPCKGGGLGKGKN